LLLKQLALASLFSCLLITNSLGKQDEVTHQALESVEEGLYEYLLGISKINFGQGVQIEPWIECNKSKTERTFFSAGLYQYGPAEEPAKAVYHFKEQLLLFARASQITKAQCFYDINYFNHCKARGYFDVQLEGPRLITFKNIDSWDWCEQEPEPEPGPGPAPKPNNGPTAL
jgi:hypothetical protein